MSQKAVEFLMGRLQLFPTIFQEEIITVFIKLISILPKMHQINIKSRKWIALIITLRFYDAMNQISLAPVLEINLMFHHSSDKTTDFYHEALVIWMSFL